MNNDETIKVLSERFQRVKENYGVQHVKYIHPKTVENLLQHASSFSWKHQQDQIYLTLSEYLDAIDGKRISNAKEALVAFNKFIRPLTKLYVDLRGFHLSIKSWITFGWGLLIWLSLYFSNAPFYFYAGLIILIIALLFRQFYFHRKKKLYGFMY